MTVKEKITEIFEQNRGSYISGEELAGMIGCTRGAIWKAVRAMQDEGYELHAVTNKGYCLLENNDIITESGIRSALSEECGIEKLEVYKVIGSTNLRIKELAAENAPEGTTAVSGEQTAGRGRLGRSFYSPSDTGVYMSILLRPKMAASEAIRITTAAAAAVAETLEELSGRETCIKWVNDIYIGGRKVCGILTEASLSLENGGLEYAVLGIGINVYEPDGGFPAEIKEVAGAVFDERRSNMRNLIAAGVLNRFMRYYSELSEKTYHESYCSRIMWVGKKINIISRSGGRTAEMLGVNENEELIVRYDDGTEGLVSSGEISIRLGEN